MPRSRVPDLRVPAPTGGLWPSESSWTMREETNFLNPFNVICPVQSSPPKINRLTRRANQNYKRRRLIPHEGRIRIVIYVGVRCGGRGSVESAWDRRADFKSVSEQPARQTNGAERTAKPCGPGTRCWCQVGGGFPGPNRA